VILINLLPHREAARKRRRDLFYASLGASAFAGAVIAGGVYLWFAAQISTQRTGQAAAGGRVRHQHEAERERRRDHRRGTVE
jgi:type IV pilus assembly protein PilN